MWFGQLNKPYFINPKPEAGALKELLSNTHPALPTWSDASSRSLRSSVCCRACLDTSMWYACAWRKQLPGSATYGFVKRWCGRR